MAERIKVRPRAGAVVLDEYGTPYPEGGAEVNRTRAVDRALLRGELTQEAAGEDPARANTEPAPDAEGEPRTHVERFDGGK
jgi:hypothetical protein